MKRLLLPATLVTIAALVGAPASAQSQQMNIRLDLVASDDDVLNEQGRLEPGVPYTTHYSFTAELPPVTGICPFGTVTMTFAIVDKPAYAAAIISPASITKAVPLAVGLAPNEIRGYNTDFTIALDSSAPSGDAGEYIVTAQAFPNTGTQGGCNVAPSYPLPVYKIVVTA